MPAVAPICRKKVTEEVVLRLCRTVQKETGEENLCLAPTFTGWDVDGGYADACLVDERYAYRLPDTVDDERRARWRLVEQIPAAALLHGQAALIPLRGSALNAAVQSGEHDLHGVIGPGELTELGAIRAFDASLEHARDAHDGRAA